MMYSSKQNVLARVRQAHGWLSGNVHGQLTHLLPLLFDVMQELEAQPTTLWMQTVVGPSRHVKVFAEGEMDVEAIETLIEMLKIARESADRRQRRNAQPQSADAVDPSAASHGTPSPREKGSDA